MPSGPVVVHTRILIVGTGFSGLAAAARLKEDGEHDLVIIERAGSVGGTWEANDYPGCACDVPSHLYSLSFAPNPAWSRAFSPQREIRRYLEDVAERYDLLPHVRFHTSLDDAAWDEDAQRWTVQTSGGAFTADVLISAAGGLSEPAVPALPGLDAFAGPAFHSARWDHTVDLTGRRVAVVGTGASAIQFVPEIQPQVERLTLLQRTPPWIMPRRDRAIGRWEQALFRRVPAAQRAVRSAIYWGRELFALPLVRPTLAAHTQKVAEAHLARSIADPTLRARLTPSYTIGCKRILLSNRYYPALTQPNVDVVTAGVREVRPHGVVTEDGVEHAADVIVFGTGFQVTDIPIAHRIVGRGGVRLSTRWDGSPSAHLGTTVAGFPNLFLLLGPNTGLGHTSITIMIEAQIEHMRTALRHMRRHAATTIEPREAVQRRWNAEVDRRGEGTVWTSGGCASWYLDKTGRNSTLWPGFTFTFRKRLARFAPGDYVFGRPVKTGPGVPAAPAHTPTPTPSVPVTAGAEVVA